MQTKHWLSLALVLIVAAIVVPLTYVLALENLPGMFPPTLLVFSVALLSLPLGSMVALLLLDLEAVTKNHHLSLVFLIPSACLAATLFGTRSDNALILGLLYAVGFIFPYILMVVNKWNSNNGHLIS